MQHLKTLNRIRRLRKKTANVRARVGAVAAGRDLNRPARYRALRLQIQSGEDAHRQGEHRGRVVLRIAVVAGDDNDQIARYCRSRHDKNAVVAHINLRADNAAVIDLIRSFRKIAVAAAHGELTNARIRLQCRNRRPDSAHRANHHRRHNADADIERKHARRVQTVNAHNRGLHILIRARVRAKFLRAHANVKDRGAGDNIKTGRRIKHHGNVAVRPRRQSYIAQHRRVAPALRDGDIGNVGNARIGNLATQRHARDNVRATCGGRGNVADAHARPVTGDNTNARRRNRHFALV